MRNTKKIVIGGFLFLSLGASSVSADYQLWANGVNKDSGWTDLTQTGPTCGPTTATNMINWWIGQAKKDYVIPETMDKSVQDLWFEVAHSGYREEYVNTTLLDYASKYGLNFDGMMERSPYYSYQRPNAGKDFETYQKISEFLKTNFEKGGICGITNNNPTPHAMTCFGAEFDANGLVTKLYIADSANNRPQNTLEVYTYVPAIFGFHTQITDWETGASISSVFAIDYIDFLLYDKDAVTGLIPLVIPEPSAFGLLAGIGALVLVALRRRRKYFTPEAFLLGEKK